VPALSATFRSAQRHSRDELNRYHHPPRTARTAKATNPDEGYLHRTTRRAGGFEKFGRSPRTRPPGPGQNRRRCICGKRQRRRLGGCAPALYGKPTYPLILGRRFLRRGSVRSARGVTDLRCPAMRLFGVLEAGRGKGAYAEKIAIGAAIVAKKKENRPAPVACPTAAAFRG